MTDVCLRIDRWLSGDLSDDADQTLRDARDEIVGLRATLKYVEAMLRERTNHDAAPAAKARTDGGSVGTDNAEPLTHQGTGDHTPNLHATPGEGTSPIWCTVTAEERKAIAWFAGYGRGEHAVTLRKLIERLE